MRTNPNRTNPNAGNDEAFFVAVIAAAVTAAIAIAASLASVSITTLATRHHLVRLPFSQLWRAAAAAWTKPKAPGTAYPASVRAEIVGPVAYWIVAGLVTVALAIPVIVVAHRLRRRPAALDRRTRFGQHIDSRLATPQEVAALRIRDVTEPDRIVLGQVGKTLVATQNDQAPTNEKAFERWAGPSHVMATAPTRMGKTYWLAQVLTLWPNPAVVLSVKGDLMERTLANRLLRGEVRVCGFIDRPPDGTRWATWDLLAEATTWDGANRLARRIASVAPSTSNARGRDEGWVEQAANVLAVELFLARHHGRTMQDVVDWTFALAPGVTDGSVAELCELATQLKSHDNLGLAKDAERALRSLTAAASGAPATWTGIYITVRRLVSPWQHPVVRRFTQPGPDAINLAWLRSGCNTLYVIASVSDGKETSAALGAFIARLIHAALDTTTDTPQRPVLFALDEMANINFRDLPEWSSVAAGAGIRLITIWQSLAQIFALYGDHAKTIINNHVTKIVFGGNSDRDTLEAGSYLGGTEHVPAHHSTFAGDPHAITTTPIVDPSLLRRLPKGRALLVHSNLGPMELRVLNTKQLRRLEQRSLQRTATHRNRGRS